MAREINLTSNEWCNIIFEGKNKEFGAYVLRQESSKRHYIAFFAVTLLVFLVSSLPRLTSALGMNKENKESYGVVDMTTFAPPEKEPYKPEIEAPKPPSTITTQSFTEIVIKKDEFVKEENELKAMEEISKSDAKISTYDNIGTDEEYGIDPADLDNNTQIGGGTVEDNEIYTSAGIEVQPSFPGGEKELMKYLNENIKYPTVAIDIGIQGKVQVQFVVGKDGSIEDVQIARGVDKSLDYEAMRVIKLMPKWIPGKQSGRAVRVKYYVPVNFRLQ